MNRHPPPPYQQQQQQQQQRQQQQHHVTHIQDWMQHFELCILPTTTSQCRMMRCKHCLAATAAVPQSLEDRRRTDIFVQAIYLPPTEWMAACHLRDCQHYHAYCQRQGMLALRETIHHSMNNNTPQQLPDPTINPMVVLPTNTAPRPPEVSESSKYKNTTEGVVVTQNGGTAVPQSYHDHVDSNSRGGSTMEQGNHIMSSLPPEWKESLAVTRKLALEGDNNSRAVSSHTEDDGNRSNSTSRDTGKQMYPPKTVSPPPSVLPTSRGVAGKRSSPVVTTPNAGRNTPKRRKTMPVEKQDNDDLSLHNNTCRIMQLEQRIAVLEQQQREQEHVTAQMQGFDRQLHHLQQCNRDQQQISRDLLALVHEMRQHHRRRRSSLSTTYGINTTMPLQVQLPQQSLPPSPSPLVGTTITTNMENNSDNNAAGQEEELVEAFGEW
eukprot:scaffold9364_cov216-Amphora_coffeaeformis.AAC.5